MWWSQESLLSRMKIVLHISIILFIYHGLGKYVDSEIRDFRLYCFDICQPCRVIFQSDPSFSDQTIRSYCDIDLNISPMKAIYAVVHIVFCVCVCVCVRAHDTIKASITK